jgi:hypothetical protein
MIRCQRCGDGSTEDQPPAAAAAAGASARAEYERRRRRDEQAVLARHPRLGKLLVAVRDERQSTKAWELGAIGEEHVGALLNQLMSIGAVVLHDRRISGTRANIDHIVVSPSCVWVVDTKRYHGQITRRDAGGWFRNDVRLYVGRRDCTKFVTGMEKQLAAMQRALSDIEVPIQRALCFTEAQWSCSPNRSTSMACS